MWKGESKEFKVMKGCYTIVEANPLQPVNETFCPLPIDGANYCYLDYLTSWALIA